jgi:hypothetical protein
MDNVSDNNNNNNNDNSSNNDCLITINRADFISLINDNPNEAMTSEFRHDLDKN